MHGRGMRSPRVPPDIAELVQHQDGVLTRGQALAAGLTENRWRGLLDGGWERLLRGVLSSQGHGWRQRAWAGVLAAGEGACLGGVAAARLHGLTEDEVEVVDVWAPGRSPIVRAQAGWRFRRGDRPAVGRPPRLRLERTILDLCAGASPDDQARWVTRALADRRTTAPRLLSALDEAGCLPGRRDLVALLRWLDTGVESPLEFRYLRDVERRHRLPTSSRQVSVVQRTRVDVHHDEFGLIVELDGRLGHRGAGELRDAWRDAAHLLQGQATVRFGWVDVVQRACVCAWLVGQLLTARGWRGQVRRCPTCPADGLDVVHLLARG